MKPELMGQDWYDLLKDEFEKPYFVELRKFLIEEYKTKTIRPSAPNIFNAFKLCRIEDIKVVIIGQDPYPSSQAHGLAFSSLGSSVPASLRYIFKEIDTDVVETKNVDEFKQLFPNSDLTSWAKQGVFLLNSILTVQDGVSNSHKGKGWEQFTKEVIKKIWEMKKPIVFMLWGNEARSVFSEAGKEVSLDSTTKTKHLVLTAGHPASGTHGKDLFSGNHHFSLANKWLMENNITPVKWTLNEESFA